MFNLVSGYGRLSHENYPTHYPIWLSISFSALAELVTTVDPLRRPESFPAGAADDAAAGDAEEDDVTRAPAAAGAGVPDSRIQRGRFNPCAHRTPNSAA